MNFIYVYTFVIFVSYLVNGEPIKVEVPEAKPPHILLVVSDDLGYNDVPWHNPTVEAPTLNKLAKEGVILEQSYVQPVCSPTRSAILSGRYPFEIGRQHSYINSLMPTGLNTSLQIIPNYLKPLGYSTHAIGKWHVGFCNWSYTPTERGFDTFRGFYTGSEDYYDHTKKWGRRIDEVELGEDKIEDQILVGYDFRNDRNVDLRAWGNYSTYLFASRVEEILESSPASDPKFIYLAFQSVHAPLQVPEKYLGPYEHIDDHNRKTLLGMVSAMDEAMGRVVNKLKETEHYDNTVIIFTSDNGGPTVYGANNWPLRGNKSTIWEGGTRAAGFVHSPLLTNGGTSSSALIHATDWLTTIVSLAGGVVPNNTNGYDQWGVISGQTQESERKELVYNMDFVTPFVAAIRDGQHKLIVGYPGPGDWIPPPEDVQNASTLLREEKRNAPESNLFSIKLANENEKSPQDKEDYLTYEDNSYVRLPSEIRKFCLHNYELCFKKYGSPKKRSGLPTPYNHRLTRPIIHFQNKKDSSASENKYHSKAKGSNIFEPPSIEKDLGDLTENELHSTEETSGLEFSTAEEFYSYQYIISLYDLKNDPEERRDLARERPDIVARLAERLLFYEDSYVPPDNPPDDPAGYPQNFGGVWSPGWC